MKVIAGRVSDRHILNGIKQWLSAAVMEEDQEGKHRTKRTERGTPQAELPPLLANIYLNLFDRMFRSYCRATGLAAELVRDAGDFVILMRGGVRQTRMKVEQNGSARVNDKRGEDPECGCARGEL